VVAYTPVIAFAALALHLQLFKVLQSFLKKIKVNI